MEKEYTTDFCELRIFKKYAIIKVFENKLHNKISGAFLKEKLAEHFGNETFVVISDRTYQYDIDLDIYKKREMLNLKGLAIVSSNAAERERAMLELDLFSDSFAFFEKMEDAEWWAQHFFS